jgi:hypothetical protein
MKREKNLIVTEAFYEGTSGFEVNDKYDKHEFGGYILKPELLKKVDAEARHRWDNGGKEVYEKFQADPDFELTVEYLDYFSKWEIPLDLPF